MEVYRKANGTYLEVLRGYDGAVIVAGDRVELHPACDLWMRGAKYGDVVSVSPTAKDRVRVTLDRVPGRVYAMRAENVRRVAP